MSKVKELSLEFIMVIESENQTNVFSSLCKTLFKLLAYPKVYPKSLFSKRGKQGYMSKFKKLPVALIT